MKKISSWRFGDSKKEADELSNLVLSGNKTATSSLHRSYLIRKKPLPKKGDKSIIKDSKNKEKCLIITTKISIKPFGKVNKSFVFKEGGGNKSLEYWRKTHKRFFKKRLKTFGEKTLIVCEEFKVLKVL